jgi:hypothetical protein
VLLSPPSGRAARRFAQSLACQPRQTNAAAHFLSSVLSSTHDKASGRLLGACLHPSSRSFFRLFPPDRELLHQ